MSVNWSVTTTYFTGSSRRDFGVRDSLWTDLLTHPPTYLLVFLGEEKVI